MTRSKMRGKISRPAETFLRESSRIDRENEIEASKKNVNRILYNRIIKKKQRLYFYSFYYFTPKAIKFVREGNQINRY